MSSKPPVIPDLQSERRDAPAREATTHLADEHAHRVLRCFEANYERIIRWLEIKTRSLAVARDIASETFVRLLELKHPIRDLTPYAYKVASYILAHRRETEATHLRLNVRLTPSSEEESVSPQPLIAAEQQSRVIQATLASLPPRIREALRLRFWEELRYAEIVEHFRGRGVVVTTRTVMRWVTEGLARFREAIDAKEGEDV